MPPPPPPTPPPPRLGLEVRTQWADALLSGAKTIELRAYPPPPAFVGAPVHLLATRGRPGVAALGDAFEAGTADATVPGWVVFGGAVEYRSPSALAADTPRHLVPADDPHYGWREKDSVLYGWRVTATGRVEGAGSQSEHPPPCSFSITRSPHSLSLPSLSLVFRPTPCTPPAPWRTAPCPSPPSWCT